MLVDSFWTSIGSTDDEVVLIFQTDSGICTTCAEGLTIDDYAEYDLCGAPFVRNGKDYFNGGFSIRNVGMSRKLLKYYDVKNEVPYEDAFFSDACTLEKGCKQCSKESANIFSVEQKQPNGDVMAFHKNWGYGVEPPCSFSKTIETLYKNYGKEKINHPHPPVNPKTWNPQFKISRQIRAK